MAVMIGIDPHKRSRTAVAIDYDEVELAAIEVRASHAQVVIFTCVDGGDLENSSHWSLAELLD
jgi:hypothetical protein